jgi:hypothetical protein
MSSRWIALRPDVPGISPDDLRLIRTPEERAIINAGIDRAVSEPDDGLWLPEASDGT